MTAEQCFAETIACPKLHRRRSKFYDAGLVQQSTPSLAGCSMGLDAVEIVMDVEDHFGISIKNAEAEHVRTVGDLVSLIQSRIAAAHLVKCSTLTSFLKIRAVVRELAVDDGLRIRTTTSIIDVLSPSQRRRLWKRFDRLLGASPPGLQRPPAMQ